MSTQIFSLRCSASACELANLRSKVKQAVLKHGCNCDCADKVVIAVNEACMNVIQHAYGTSAAGDIVLEIFDQQNTLIFRITDFAKTIDHQCIKPRDISELRPGGLGVHLICEIMDEIEYIKPECGIGNILEMRKKKSNS